MKKLWIRIVQLFGWHYDNPAGDNPTLQRAVYIMAPHTSIYDFFLGAGCVWYLKLNARFFIKKEFFNWFTNPILKSCGAVPVDRGNPHNNLVSKAVRMFQENEHFAIVITPEGTRSRVKRWKHGFYDIAIKAQVPIVLTFIDYKTRHMGLDTGSIFYPTGDFNADMKEIMKFYQNRAARHPEKFNKDIAR